MADLPIKGLDELNDFLQKLPEKMERNVMRSSMRKGVQYLQALARSRAPVGPPSRKNARDYGGYAGALRDSIRVGTSYKRGTVTAYVRAGGRSKKTNSSVYYAHMVAYGTKRHIIIPKKRGGRLRIGNEWVSAVMHPGTRPRPFMRPAIDVGASGAIEATAAAMRTILAKKYGLNAAHQAQEGDE